MAIAPSGQQTARAVIVKALSMQSRNNMSLSSILRNIGVGKERCVGRTIGPTMPGESGQTKLFKKNKKIKKAESVRLRRQMGGWMDEMESSCRPHTLPGIASPPRSRSCRAGPRALRASSGRCLQPQFCSQHGIAKAQSAFAWPGPEVEQITGACRAVDHITRRM